MATKVWDVFLSYANEDVDAAHRVADALREQGLRVFVSSTELNLRIGSSQWSAAVDEALDQSVCLVLLLTPTSLASKWVAYEWRGIHEDILAGRGGLLIPLCWQGPAPDELPRALRRHQAVDCRGGGLGSDELKQLLDLIRGYQQAMAGPPRQPDSLAPTRPRSTLGAQGSRRSTWLVLGAVAVGVVALIGVLIASLTSSSPNPTSTRDPAGGPPPDAGTASAAATGSDGAGAAAAAPSVVPSAAPYPFGECEQLSKNFGAWSPSPLEVAAAAAQVATRACYGYWEHDPRRLAATVQACAAAAGASTVSFQVPRSEGGCSFKFRSASFEARKWIWVETFYARAGQFGNQIDILELSQVKLTPYASAWQCNLSWEEAARSQAPPHESGEVSAVMRADWRAFPPPLRGFLCKAEFFGESLTAPAPE